MILTYQINAMGPLLVIKVPTANKKINFGMFYRFQIPPACYFHCTKFCTVVVSTWQLYWKQEVERAQVHLQRLLQTWVHGSALLVTTKLVAGIPTGPPSLLSISVSCCCPLFYTSMPHLIVVWNCKGIMLSSPLSVYRVSQITESDFPWIKPGSIAVLTTIACKMEFVTYKKSMLCLWR